MELVAGEDSFCFEGFHVFVGDLDAAGVGVGVEFGVDGEPGLGGDGFEGFDDDFVRFQGPAAPVPADRGEQPVLDLVPFRGAGRQVADGDRRARFRWRARRVRFSRAAAGSRWSRRSRR